MSHPPGEDLDFYDHYKDTGCRLHPACLECPLPVCVYDNPASVQIEIRHHGNDMEKVNAVEEAMVDMGRSEAVRLVADKFGYTERAIFAVLQRVRER